MNKFSAKTTFSLLNLWGSFKKTRGNNPEDFGPDYKSWLSVLDRELLIDELFIRLGESSLQGKAC